MDRRAFLATGAGVAAAVLAGCAAGGSGGGEYDVGMSTDAFRPETVTVEVGETVVWRNTSKQGHTVTAYGDQLPDGADYFASGEFASQSAADEYGYFCIPHEEVGMVGVVTVEESGSE
ncbi:halocyanin [Halobacteriales archaeon QH_6_68_27]|nr:MAG: halocyanin [Halobacteriales archaeon QH_6_68_27]